MQATTIDEYLKLDDIFDPEERQQLHLCFPYILVVECDFPEFNNAIRWCWTKFGPKHGECYPGPEYAACPLALETEYLVESEVGGIKYRLKKYKSVPRHCHVGEWNIFWLGKTDYDHGFCEFGFANEVNKNEFEQHVPNIDWGENYPWRMID